MKTYFGRENCLGQRETSIGQRETSIGQRENSIGQREASIGQRETSLGQRETSLGERETSLGHREISLGQRETSLGERMADSREADYAMNPNETEAFQPGAGSQDFNSNREDEPQKVGKKVSDYALAEHNVAFPVQGIPAAGIPSDPSLRQAYAMPATGHGLTLAQNSNQSSPSRYYKMASDIFGTGMDKTWTASSGPGNNAPQNPITGNPMSQRHVPNSFKITEMSANTNAGNEEQAEAGATGAGRRARESSGNPLTGQGFNQENAKTGKRYFEGSNANQKLW